MLPCIWNYVCWLIPPPSHWRGSVSFWAQRPIKVKGKWEMKLLCRLIIVEKENETCYMRHTKKKNETSSMGQREYMKRYLSCCRYPRRWLHFASSPCFEQSSHGIPSPSSSIYPSETSIAWTLKHTYVLAVFHCRDSSPSTKSWNWIRSYLLMGLC